MSDTFKKHWQAEIKKNQDLQRQLEEAREGEKKAFWSGFELAKMNSDCMNIQKHWNHYKKLKEKGDE
jgi:DNA-binding transcriptional regulator GbsR (MarR family)